MFFTLINVFCKRKCTFHLSLQGQSSLYQLQPTRVIAEERLITGHFTLRAARRRAFEQEEDPVMFRVLKEEIKSK